MSTKIVRLQLPEKALTLTECEDIKLNSMIKQKKNATPFFV